MSEHSIRFGILTVSDTCFRKEKDDKSGKNLCEEIVKAFPKSVVVFYEVVPDDRDLIIYTMKEWCTKYCNVILTTGGTGFSPRDITPEATRCVIEREAPGLTLAMITRSLAVTEMAMLSRAVCGIRDKTLIINLPGSTKGASECFNFIKGALPHAADLLLDDTSKIEQAHQKIQQHRFPNHFEPSSVKIDNLASRPRTSPYPLLEVDDACKLVLDKCKLTEETEVVNVEDSLNRILAECIYAEGPFPPFPASMKDGYAVRYEDGPGLRVVKEASAAGDNPSKVILKAGEAVRITTGAAVPEGANAVVQVEDTDLFRVSEDSCQELEINIKTSPTQGLDIREVGSDILANSLVLDKYDKIDYASIGVLATLGKNKISVFKKPTIGILSTGNELCSHVDVLMPGQIRDSNKLTLLNLLRQYSYNSVDCGIARDNPDSVKLALENALSANDIVVTTGGVSMGEYDLVKQILLQDFKAIIHFGRVNMKPGKPTTFATLNYQGVYKMIFGLPGNPVSACVTCLLFVLPALKHLEHSQHISLPKVRVTVKDPQMKNNDTRPEYVRVKLQFTEEGIVATTTGSQMSSRLNSVVGANGLLYLPGKSSTQNDAYYDAYVINDLL